ncbi:MAG: DNRLRE domain-containing protein [Verrucomicrobiales bacterium]
MKATTPVFFALLALSSTATHGAITMLDSTEDGHIRSGSPSSNYESDSYGDRLLVGNHFEPHLADLRGLLQFDVSAYAGMSINSVSLSLTQVGGVAADDQAAGSFDILLKDMGTPFLDESVTWNSLTPAGGDVSGTVLSTVAAYTIPSSAGGTTTFATSSDFIAALEAAANGSGVLSLVVYSPGAEALSGESSFYRFDNLGTLTIDAVPEPTTAALSLLAASAFLRRRRA